MVCCKVFYHMFHNNHNISFKWRSRLSHTTEPVLEPDYRRCTLYYISGYNTDIQFSGLSNFNHHT